jgi:hypothetical protein
MILNQKIRMSGPHHKNGRRKDSKKILNGKSHTTRVVGKLRIRWEEVVQKNALLIPGV